MQKHTKPVGIRLVHDVPAVFEKDGWPSHIDGIRCVTYDHDDPYIRAIPDMIMSFSSGYYGFHDGSFNMSQIPDGWYKLFASDMSGTCHCLIYRLQKMLDDGEVRPEIPGRMSDVLSSSHSHAKVMDFGSLASGLFLASMRSNSPTLMYGALKVMDVMYAISPMRLGDRRVFSPEHMTETASGYGDCWADLDDGEAPFAFYSLIGPKSYGRMMNPEDNDDFVLSMYPLSCEGYWEPGSERTLVPDSSTDADMERFIDGTGDCIAVGLTGNNPHLHDLNSGSIVLARQAWPLITERIWAGLADMVASGSPTGFMIETMKGMLRIHDATDDESED